MYLSIVSPNASSKQLGYSTDRQKSRMTETQSGISVLTASNRTCRANITDQSLKGLVQLGYFPGRQKSQMTETESGISALTASSSTCCAKHNRSISQSTRQTTRASKMIPVPDTTTPKGPIKPPIPVMVDISFLGSLSVRAVKPVLHYRLPGLVYHAAPREIHRGVHIPQIAERKQTKTV